jgi:peptidoglycan/xylan/chitin deacetylase (PgdA/CDA1 family)
VKQAIKLAFVNTLHFTGVLWAMASLALRGKVVVLTYHRVLPADARRNSFSASSIIVTPGTFDRHVRFVKRFLTPLTGEQFAEVLTGRAALPPRACLITFDDGWYDNLAHALPVLQKHGVPAVLFVATDYIGSDRPFWQERATRLLFNVWQSRTHAKEVFTKLGAPHVTDLNETAAREAVRECVSRLKNEPHDGVAKLIAELQAILASTGAASVDEDRFLDWQQVETMAKSGLVTIGSHAVSHLPLTSLDPGRVASELETSRRQIESRLKIRPALLAYPNGDCNKTVADLAKAAGYSFAFTTERGYVATSSDPFRLRRINVHESATPTPAALLARIAGLY